MYKNLLSDQSHKKFKSGEKCEDTNPCSVNADTWKESATFNYELLLLCRLKQKKIKGGGGGTTRWVKEIRINGVNLLHVSVSIP